ncbi:MAG TPA: DNA polymerase Y family protein [Gammaproteobacteria bacterium]|nr:DNA polymerase Y family protein [Gammaproteobacteria bacterium]
MALPSSLPKPRPLAGLRLVAPCAAEQESATEPQRLWCALHFPHLVLAACADTKDIPQAVIETDGTHAQLVACNAAAQRAGVQPGMRVAAALALIPELAIHTRDMAREAHLLDQLAAWSEKFTPTVCVSSPDMLLLEVAGSAHLFGGAQGLQQRAREGLQALGHATCVALAPTPVAAEWFARSGRETVVMHAAQLPAALGALPLAALSWPAVWCARFEQLGLRTVRDLFRLPRDGLARRFGPELLRTWDRVLGNLPDPRKPRQAPLRFSARQELPAETADTAQMLPYISCLFEALCAGLRRHDATTGNVVLGFRHLKRAETQLPLGLLAPTRDPARWRQLAQQALQKRVLPEAVTELTLTSGAFLRHAPPPADLFERAGRSGEDLAALMDKLRARLGRRAIARLRVLADHRPEFAWQGSSRAQRSTPIMTAPRPLWLLEQAQCVRVHAQQLRLQGKTLTLLDGPERIESGWWDERDLARDYYTARSTDGRRLWLYRERGAGRWFVHGLFA